MAIHIGPIIQAAQGISPPSGHSIKNIPDGQAQFQHETTQTQYHNYHANQS